MGTIFFLVGLTAIGWLFVGAVAGLQVLLAATGVCIGCRLYFVHWWVPALFTRIVGRSDGPIPVRLVRPDWRSGSRP